MSGGAFLVVGVVFGVVCVIQMGELILMNGVGVLVVVLTGV